MSNIDKLSPEKKANVEAILAKAKAKVEAQQANTKAEVEALEKAVNAPAPEPATVVKKAPAKKDDLSQARLAAAVKDAHTAAKKEPAKKVGKDIVDSIKVITVLPPTKVVEAEIVTGPAPYTKAKAENLDKRIIATVGKIADNFDVLEGLVKEAKEGQIHIALGFASWTAYFAARINTKFAEIADRQMAALMLHEEGMSNRAIASTLGVSSGTVVTDVKAAKAKKPAASTAAAPAKPGKTVGKDGKEYKRPATANKPPVSKPAPKPKLSDLEIRTDLALADAENLVDDIESLIGSLEKLYSTPEFVAGGDKEIQGNITKARKLLASLPKAPTRRKPLTATKGA